MLSNKKNYLGLIIFSFFIYFLNPIATEFSQSGGVLSGLQQAKKNIVFHFYTLEFSSQFVVSSLLLIIFKSSLFVEFFGGVINVILASIAIFQWVRLFDEKFKERKNILKIFFIIILFNILNFSLNLSYPIKFPLSYSIFGNSGMWLSIMILGMILRNKSEGYFLFGILLSWHLVWALFLFVCTLPLIKFFHHKKNCKIKLISLLIGCFVSLIFYLIFKVFQNNLIIDGNIKNYYFNLNNFYNIFKPEILNPSQITFHNIALNDYVSFFKILFIVFYGLSFFLVLRKMNIELIFYKKIIISFGIIGFILTLYVALASYIPLIGSNFLARMIPNRIFNFLIILNTILVCYFILFLIDNNKLSKKQFTIGKIMAFGWLIIAHKISGIAVVLVFVIKILLQSLKFIKKIFNINLIFISTLIIVLTIKLIFLNRYYFTIYDYLLKKDEIIRALKTIEPKKSLILIGPNVSPPFNIFLSAPIEYIPTVNIGQYFIDIDVITKCGRKNKFFSIGFNGELDLDCLKKIESAKWIKIKKKTNITHILIKNDDKKEDLKIPKIAETKRFKLYILQN
jgi:hypothetical protein